MLAEISEQWPETCTRGVVGQRRRWTLKCMRLDECHRITELTKRRSWSLIVRGPKRRGWGFYAPDGWIPWTIYDAERRRDGLVAEISNVDDPRIAQR